VGRHASHSERSESEDQARRLQRGSSSSRDQQILGLDERRQRITPVAERMKNDRMMKDGVTYIESILDGRAEAFCTTQVDQPATRAT